MNATDTSFDDATIVTGDDFGLVKLFRFPCIRKGKLSSAAGVRSPCFTNQVPQ